MPIYKMAIYPEPILVSIDANNPTEAHEKAEIAFFHDYSHGLFELDYVKIDSTEEEG